MSRMPLLFIFVLLSGCVSRDPLSITASNFRSSRIERELNFYVTAHPLHPINHFYVGATKLDHGQLVEAMVYWKEERILLPYTELEADATHDVFAWQGHELKLGQDTVDTVENIDGSNYLVTHRQWAEWEERCVSKGKPYSVSLTKAREMFPESKAQR